MEPFLGAQLGHIDDRPLNAAPTALIMFSRAIVRPPAPNFAEGLTTAALGAPDYQRALAQHEAYCAALERCGLTLTRLAAEPDYPDSTFVEDAAILAEASDGDQTLGAQRHDVESRIHPLTQVVLTNPLAILTRPGAPSRLGEVATIRKALTDFFPALAEIHSPGTLDGGDVCQANNHFFIGVSSRTNKAGAQQLTEILAAHGYTTSLVDIRGGSTGVSPVGHALDDVCATSPILHLKSGIAYIGDNRLVVVDALADRAEFVGYELVLVNSEEAYAANCVWINEHVLLAAGYPAFESELQQLGYQIIALEMSEFQKMDGGLSCLSLRF
jgi:dimethylargininase